MKAAVLETYNAPLVVRDLPDPTPTKRGAVVRTAANGICRSDWHAWAEHWPGHLKLPHVLGHEMCGIVEETGPDVTRFKAGDRVIVPFSGGDGSCPWCHAGLPNICDHPVMPGFASWGGFAELVAVDNADLNLVALPESISFVAAAGMGCRYMTSFHGVARRANVGPGEWVAVFGCGGIGLSAVEIATALGANVIGIDIGEDKLEMARTLGAVATVNARSSNDPVAEVKELTGGGAHVAVDALGLQVTCRNATKSLRKRGRHLQIGMTTNEANGELMVPIDDIIGAELVLLGSKGMAPHDFGAMLRMIEAGKLDPARLVTRTVPLEEAGAVLAAMDSFETLGFTVIDRF